MTGSVSPLEPLPQSDDPEFRSFTQDFEDQFFNGEEQVKAEVVLMRETWDELLKIIEVHEWKQNEGLVILLTTGMAYLRAERALHVPQTVSGLSETEVQKLLDRLMVIEARYASIKNFAFDVMRDHRILEIKFAPIEQEYRSFKGMVWTLRKENDALKAENERLRRALQARAPAADEPPAPRQRRFWQRLWGVLRSRSDNA